MRTKEFNADVFRKGAPAVTRDGHRVEFVREMTATPGIPLGVIVHGEKQDYSAMYPESGKGVLDKDDLLLIDVAKQTKEK